MSHCGADWSDVAPFTVEENRVERFAKGDITLEKYS